MITRTEIMTAFLNLYDNIDEMPITSTELMNFLYPGESEHPVEDIEQYMQRYLSIEDKSKAVLLLDKQNAGIVLDEEYEDNSRNRFFDLIGMLREGV